jgi:hypothetical protein
MKVKAKILVNLDDRGVVSIDFNDDTLNSCPISKELMSYIYNKVMKTSIKKFTMVANSSLDPIGNPYHLLVTKIEVHPKIFTVEKKHVGFRYDCILQLTSYGKNVISYQQYAAKRLEYVKELQLKMSELQSQAEEKA